MRSCRSVSLFLSSSLLSVAISLQCVQSLSLFFTDHCCAMVNTSAILHSIKEFLDTMLIRLLALHTLSDKVSAVEKVLVRKFEWTGEKVEQSDK